MRILITAGGTREYIDPVRFITNASSGRMGYELARAALKAGHKVTLISTVNRDSSLLKQADIIKVESAADMLEAVKKYFVECDCLIMAAAVADYTPAKESKTKIKKEKSTLLLKLKPTVDILKWAGKNKKQAVKGKNKIIVGFALEDTNLLDNAEKKLKKKNLDMIIANNVNAIDSVKTTIYVRTPDTEWLTFENKSKSTLASKIIKMIDQY